MKIKQFLFIVLLISCTHKKEFADKQNSLVRLNLKGKITKLIEIKSDSLHDYKEEMVCLFDDKGNLYNKLKKSSDSPDHISKEEYVYDENNNLLLTIVDKDTISREIYKYDEKLNIIFRKETDILSRDSFISTFQYNKHNKVVQEKTENWILKKYYEKNTVIDSVIQNQEKFLKSITKVNNKNDPTEYILFNKNGYDCHYTYKYDQYGNLQEEKLFYKTELRKSKMYKYSTYDSHHNWISRIYYEDNIFLYKEKRDITYL